MGNKQIIDDLNDLILLVGSNTLPNYLAACKLNPKNRIFLLYSKETEKPQERLKKVLKDNFSKIEVKAEPIKNPGNGREIQEWYKRKNISGGAHLNYTGGTKAMSVHIFEAWKEMGNSDSNASYIDDRNSRIRFADGESCPLNVKLDFETLTELQGIDVKKGGWGKKVTANCRQEDSYMSAQEVFCEGKEKEKNKDKWLEKWLACVVKDKLGIDDFEIHTNFKGLIDEREFEIDVRFIKGHRLYVLSCTTRNDRECKKKLYEIAFRARQLGGDLARSAVACFAGNGHKNDITVEELRNIAKNMWDAPNETEIFGYEDLKDIACSNTKKLDEWLEN